MATTSEGCFFHLAPSHRCLAQHEWNPDCLPLTTRHTLEISYDFKTRMLLRTYGVFSNSLINNDVELANYVYGKIPRR